MKPLGIFVSIDGPNGVGKSTLAANVQNHLLGERLRIHVTKEVTNSKLGKFIRESHRTFQGKTLALLVAADRQYHVEHDIIPALRLNDIVITDRYIGSSLVYQTLDGVDLPFIWQINCDFPKPALSVFVTAPPEMIVERMKGRENYDRFEEQFRREQELQRFREAFTFLESKGFKVLALSNEDANVDEAARTLVKHVLDMVAR